jgi:thymidylate synthase ThyX
MTIVKVVADSISLNGKRITTIECEYPRLCHSELMTHRVFSRNASSSRAIPGKSMRKHISASPYIPTYWGKDQRGMQAKTQLKGLQAVLAKIVWKLGIKLNLFGSALMSFLGVHKQLANRNTEYCSYIKVVITSTEWDNFFKLRCHKDAQPEIQDLANLIRLKLLQSTPETLRKGEWHTPYVAHKRKKHTLVYENDYTVEDAKRISASCCAQVSYRVLNTSKEKALNIWDRLVESDPIHASPFEHVATPINGRHGNFNGWQQLRQEIENKKRGARYHIPLF